MAKFNFTFQSVLGIKEKMEEQRQIELGNAIKALHIEQSKLEEIVYKRNTYENEFYEKNGKNIKVRALLALSEGIKYYMDAAKQQQRVIEESEQFVEKKRIVLQEAVHERKIYERLKEKAYEAYLEEIKIEENKFLDEVVSFKYNIDAH